MIRGSWDREGISTNMVRTHGRALRGQRLLGDAPHGYWKVATFVSGLRSTGIIAPLLIDFPMNGATFRQYVEECFVPELKPRDIVILDNLSSHKAAARFFHDLCDNIGRINDTFTPRECQNFIRNSGRA